jgi:hypothetical protein
VVSFVAVSTCIFPAEHDSSVHVSLSPIHILVRGRDTIATAKAWQIVDPRDSQPIPNVVFVWSSSNPSVATVDNTGRIVAVNSGTAILTAAAASFDKAARAAQDTLRVSAPLEIDSISPDTVKFGQTLTIYGVGVDSITSATFGSVALIKVPFSDAVFSNGTARTRYWVPPPAVTDSLFFLGIYNGNGVFGFVHGSATTVIQRDLYDPNDTTPKVLSLDGPGPFPGTTLASLLFFNPALAFEALPRGRTAAADWYRFHQSTARDITVILESPERAGTFATYLSDSLGWNGATKQYVIGRNSWTFGPGSHACHGLQFRPPEAVTDSTIAAFKGLALGNLDAIAIYTQAGRYGLAVISGYTSELPADSHEDDNSCNAADLRGTASLPFRDTLAIENPHDIDWIRFAVAGSVAAPIRFRIHAITGVHPDSAKDLDFYVIKVPNPGDTALSIVLADTAVTPGVDHDKTILLAPGNYYGVVLDFAGVTTYYEICAAPALGACDTAFPAPPAAAATPAGGALSAQAAVPPRPRHRPRPRRAPLPSSGFVPSRDE